MNCGYYALTLQQCCQALGFISRPVSICKADTEWQAPDEGNTGHSVMEVWSHEHHKWVLLDADMNVHYLIGCTPLSVLEIHTAFVTNRWDEVEMRLCGPTPVSSISLRVHAILYLPVARTETVVGGCSVCRVSSVPLHRPGESQVNAATRHHGAARPGLRPAL